MQVLVFMLLPVFVFLGLFAYHEQTFFQVAEMWGGGVGKMLVTLFICLFIMIKVNRRAREITKTSQNRQW